MERVRAVRVRCALVRLGDSELCRLLVESSKTLPDSGTLESGGIRFQSACNQVGRTVRRLYEGDVFETLGNLCPLQPGLSVAPAARVVFEPLVQNAHQRHRDIASPSAAGFGESL